MHQVLEVEAISNDRCCDDVAYIGKLLESGVRPTLELILHTNDYQLRVPRGHHLFSDHLREIDHGRWQAEIRNVQVRQAPRGEQLLQ